MEIVSADGLARAVPAPAGPAPGGSPPENHPVGDPAPAVDGSAVLDAEVVRRRARRRAAAAASRSRFRCATAPSRRHVQPVGQQYGARPRQSRSTQPRPLRIIPNTSVSRRSRTRRVAHLPTVRSGRPPLTAWPRLMPATGGVSLRRRGATPRSSSSRVSHTAVRQPAEPREGGVGMRNWIEGWPEPAPPVARLAASWRSLEADCGKSGANYRSLHPDCTGNDPLGRGFGAGGVREVVGTERAGRSQAGTV